MDEGDNKKREGDGDDGEEEIKDRKIRRGERRRGQMGDDVL